MFFFLFFAFVQQQDQGDVPKDAASASFNVEPTATALQDQWPLSVNRVASGTTSTASSLEPARKLFDSQWFVPHDAHANATSRLANCQRITLDSTASN